MMTALLSVGAWAVDDISLSVVKAGMSPNWAASVDSNNVVTLYRGGAVEWALFPAISTANYTGVEVVFAAAPAIAEGQSVSLSVYYEGESEAVSTTYESGTTLSATFAADKKVSMVALSTGWSDQDAQHATFTLSSVTIKGASGAATAPSANLSLPFGKIAAPAGWGLTIPENTQNIVISRYSSAGWTFTTAVNTTEYTGINLTLTQAPAEGGSITIKYDGAAEQTISVNASTTSVVADFEQSGTVTGIYFNGDGWHENDTDTLGNLTYGIGNCYLVVNTPETDGDYTITINAAENGSVTADHTKANEGETITLTVTPASDSYKMVSLTIEQTTDDEGDGTPVLNAPRRTPGFASNVEYEKVDDTHYTFVMPANDVEISAVFTDNPVARPTITYDAPNNKVTLSLTKNPTGEDAGFAVNAKVYYTTDGTDPTTSDTKQESETDVDITVTKDITIIRAVGVSSDGHYSVEVSQEVSLVRYLTVSKEWTVFCSPETFSVPEGLKAYTISAVTQPDNDGEAGSVTLKEQTLIAEGVPMVIQNTQIESSTTKFQIQEAEGEIADTDMCANFKGSATGASTLSSTSKNYVLKNGEFIRTTATKVSQYNCYLEFGASTPSAAPRYSITIGGNTTSVKAIGAATLDEGDWYTLGGVRMQQPNQKGVYIHGGKKVVIK